MRYLLPYLLCSIFVLSGCAEQGKKPKAELLLNYTTEEEKLLKETFLQVIGTELYYKISDRHLEEVRRMEERGASEKEIINYYDKYKEEDPRKIVVFTRDEFLSTYSAGKRFKNIHPELLSHIRRGLEHGGFIESGDSATQILETLSHPLKISYINLFQTGRYKLVKEQNKKKVKGEYKTYGSFNSSKVFIDENRKRAVFFYEKDCMEGNKCARGTLVLLKKENNRWKVSKQINIYLT